MDFRQLANFVKVLELKSLSRAADQLGIGQPALGMQIRALEEELGQQLVTRHSRGVDPTEAGLLLLNHARPIIAALDDARRKLIELNEPRGRVALGMVPPANSLLLAGIVQRVRADLPQVGLSIVEELTTSLVARVQSGELDLACIYGHEQIRGLVIEPLVADFLCFVTANPKYSSRDTIPFAEVTTCDLILPTGPNLLRQRLETVAREQRRAVEPVLEVQSEAIVKDLVEQGVGDTVLPFNSVQRATNKGLLRAIRIVEPGLPSTMSLAWREGRTPSRAADKVRDIILTISKAHAALPGRKPRSPLPVRGAVGKQGDCK